MHSIASLPSRRPKMLRLPDKRWPETILFLLYLALSVLVSAFHEPWFDEAQSWMIAHDATLSDILFYLPHSEGHPPLWHLVLLPFAKLNAPYLFSIKLINLVISGASVALILFRSPFPRPVRLLLPFTYFIFYQYGVISRPYSLMCLAFLLCAMAYTQRMKKPFRYALALALLCLTSAYGILFAGGIAFCWLLETLSSRRGMSFSTLFRDRRLLAMAGLLVVALLLIVEIAPLPDAFAVANPRETKNGLLVRLMYTLLVMPADAIVYNAMPVMSVLEYSRFSTVNLIGGAFVGVIIWLIFLFLGYRKRKVLLLTVPFALFALFGALVYFSTHHIGIALLFLLYWLWVCCEETVAPRPLPEGIAHMVSEDKSAIFRRLMQLSLIAVFVVQIVWSLSASIKDIKYPYSESRTVADFIERYALTDNVIMMQWVIDEETVADDQLCSTPNPDWVVNVNAYFGRNIVSNYNYNNHSVGYEQHRLVTKDMCEAELISWREIGMPDLLIGSCAFDELYPDGSVSMDDYIAVCRVDRMDIWKSDLNSEYWWYLYMKKDLAQQYGLEELIEEPCFQIE